MPKKLLTPVNHRGFAGRGMKRIDEVNKLLIPSMSSGSGSVLLEQLWNIEGSKGISLKPPKIVTLLSSRAVFVPPKHWVRVYLPYKICIEGGVTVVLSLQKEGLIAGLSLTRGGQLRVNIWNPTDGTIYLTQKTAMVNIIADRILVKHFGQDIKLVNGMSQVRDDFTEDLKREVMEKYSQVGDFSTHPVNENMEKLKVRASEVIWVNPVERGSRTQYAVERVADRQLVDKQLQEYVQRGYLYNVSVGEDVYLSPLLPIRKPNGTFRFTNDFRKLNTYFPSNGETIQVDVWRKLWELKPEWKFFMEIDLKDGFFSIPVEEKLSKLFGFSYGTNRFRWGRLPQGWKWSSVLFHERIAEILSGLQCPQYSDNVLVGAPTLVELRLAALNVFSRFSNYGIKVNFEKVKWVCTEITFLGYEIKNGLWNQAGFIKKRMDEIGKVQSIKDLERIIGIISYSRRCIKDSELILGPLRKDLKRFKSGAVTEEWKEAVDDHVMTAFKQAITNMHWLTLPGMKADEYKFILESDWSSGYSGYMLFARRDGEDHLVDIGSRAHGLQSSSYLGELDAVVWACKRTKAFRGSIPLIIRTDSNSLYSKVQSGSFYDADVRVFRRWAWLLANEPGFRIEFVPGTENSGADLLSRPVEKTKPKKVQVLNLHRMPDIGPRQILREKHGMSIY